MAKQDLFGMTGPEIARLMKKKAKNPTKFDRDGRALTDVFDKSGKRVLKRNEFNAIYDDSSAKMTLKAWDRAFDKFVMFLGLAAYRYYEPTAREMDVFLYKCGLAKRGDGGGFDLKKLLAEGERLNRTLPIGRCPWCRERMVIGDEDPVLERSCDDCASETLAKLKKKNPKFYVRYRKAEVKLLGRIASDVYR